MNELRISRTDELQSWIDANSSSEVVWYLKRLSATEAMAGGSESTGLWMPVEFIQEIIPQSEHVNRQARSVNLALVVDEHSAESDRLPVTIDWQDEARLSGVSGTGLLNPEHTGALMVFAFRRGTQSDPVPDCHVWICEKDSEEDLLEDRVGQVDPGEYRIWSFGKPVAAKSPGRTSACWLQPEQIPAEWHQKFPTGQQIIDLAIKSAPPFGHDIDKRILARRECEFLIFQSIEEAIELPTIQKGFDNIDEFVQRAQTILQRRKSRSGRSLELHARQIFREEGLVEDTDFDFQPRVEGGKAPDYLFPIAANYDDLSFPTGRLRMLAVKTTCKDRWRQVLNEADRIETKHLLTLQEGVSENQFREMRDANLQLVVPAPLHRHYPESIRGQLMSLSQFVSEVKSLSQ